MLGLAHESLGVGSGSLPAPSSRFESTGRAAKFCSRCEAATRGYVDAMIELNQTQARLIASPRFLATKWRLPFVSESRSDSTCRVWSAPHEGTT